jgi:hypothetical protein
MSEEVRERVQGRSWQESHAHSLQDKIAHTIAGAIEPEILKFERERIQRENEHSDRERRDSYLSAIM